MISSISHEGPGTGRRLLDLDNGADHQAAEALIVTAQGQLLPADAPGDALVPIAALGELILPATSNFRPDDLIIDLLMTKRITYSQRIHHDGFEIYSATPSYLISAGGIATDSPPPCC